MTSLWLAAGFVSCLDEPLMDDEEIGEGTAMVSFDITSVPQTDAELGKSRAEGEAIGSINNVFVAFYKTDGKLAYRFYFDSPKTEQIKL